MTRFLLTLAAAATATITLFTAATLPAQARAPREISQTRDGKPILLASVTVTATALPE
jgi:hypothetical protein